MPRELILTPQDRALLKAIDQAFQPKPVVSAEQYCRLLESADSITRENFRIRKHRKRLLRMARRIQKSRKAWCWAAMASGAIAAVLTWTLLGRIAG